MSVEASPKTIVLLLSDKRSGSTMFQSELSKHPLVHTVDYSSHTYLETHHWLKAAVMLNKDKRDFASQKIYNGYGSVANARAYMIDTIKGNCTNFEVPESDRELVFKGWDALCEKFAKPVFFEKSPQFLAHWASLELILEWMKDTKYSVKIVGLTRNPMAVMYSAYELFHTNPEKRQKGWMNIQNNLLRFKNAVPKESICLLRYEDLVADPRNSFAAVCDFIGIPMDDEMGNIAHRDSLRKWQDDPYYSFKLNAEATALAKNFGYSDDDLYNPPKSKAPLSYRFKKSWKRTVSLSLTRIRDRFIQPLKLKWKK